MAEDKKSFVAYTDWNETFKKLTNDEAGKLSKMIFSFVSDENPTAPDRITELLFEPIKQHLKRDLKKYESIKQKRVEAGRSGGLKSGEVRSKELPKNKEEALASLIKQNEASASKNQANEAVNVNGNVNGNVIESKEEEKKDSHVLLESNLFRKPTVPTKQNVLECFIRNGGTKEMASKFWNKNNDLGWFINGSPIIKVDGLIANYVQSWKNNEKNKPDFKQERKSAPPLKEA